MSSNPRDWYAVASGKLSRVLGPSEGTRVLAETLAELQLEGIDTHEDFATVATALSKRTGYAAMVGSLLAVHATVHRPDP